jgi:CheY-like chemotaxis protein
MLTTSKAAAPVVTSLDLNGVVSGVVRTLAPLLGEQVQVALQLDPRLGRVRANMGQLEQTLMNLLLNARDAMPDGGRVAVETGNVDLEQSPTGPLRAVMVRITDTGSGMDAATLSRAFEPYFTTKAPGRGTGLGLATVFAFVSQSGGHVEASSEVGRGSTFTVYLPRHDAEDEPLTTAGTAAAVLVVEPEPGVRDLIAEILDLHGYRVLSARDLDEALAASMAYQGPIALVIADLLLPGVAGDGVLQRLGPARASSRVLYLSGDLEDTVEEYRGLRPGRGFLHKPFTVDALVQRVREIIATR